GPLPVPHRLFHVGVQRNEIVPGQQRKTSPAPAASTEISEPLVRTALAVEPRDGQLWVFLPPVSSAEDFVDLIAAVEDTAARLEMPVAVEGYPPPHDSRLRQIKVTPDPGVIEVN